MDKQHSVSWFEVTHEKPRSRLLRWASAIVVGLFLNWLYMNALPTSHGIREQLLSESSNGELEIEMVQDDEWFRYVETNPDKAENEPDDTPNISARDQQAAQENVAGPRRESTPFVEGEDPDSMKLLEGAMPEEGEETPLIQRLETQPTPQEENVDPSMDAPRPPSRQRAESAAQPDGRPSMDAPRMLDELPSIPPPPPTPDFIDEVETQDEEGVDIRIIRDKGQENEALMMEESEDRVLNINIPPSVAEQLSRAQEESQQQEHQDQQSASSQNPRSSQQPMPRPRLSPNVLPGPLLDSQVYAARMGPIGFDAKFSQFGHYLSRMFEAIQLQWYSLLNDVTISQENRPASVVIRYSLNYEGRVIDSEVLSTDAGQLGTLLCRDAIESRAPFGAWTLQMIDQLGEETKITVRFIYL